MTLGRYRACPLVGHLDRAKRIVGYLKKFPHGAIRFRTDIPNHESIWGDQVVFHDWMYTVYGNPTEELPHNAPTPKGKAVRTSTFVDANLMHDFTTGRSATGILHFINQTPVWWFSKRQGQSETATYGSEFVAARVATEQIIDLRYSLRMLGVPLEGLAWMFGDNQSVVTSSTIPHSTLSKRWNALSYHRVREAIAAKVLRFEFLKSTENPADVLTKPLDHTTAWPFLDTLLFRKGETMPKNSSSLPEGSVNLSSSSAGSARLADAGTHSDSAPVAPVSAGSLTLTSQAIDRSPNASSRQPQTQASRSRLPQAQGMRY